MAKKLEESTATTEIVTTPEAQPPTGSLDKPTNKVLNWIQNFIAALVAKVLPTPIKAKEIDISFTAADITHLEEQFSQSWDPIGVGNGDKPEHVGVSREFPKQMVDQPSWPKTEWGSPLLAPLVEQPGLPPQQIKEIYTYAHLIAVVRLVIGEPIDKKIAYLDHLLQGIIDVQTEVDTWGAVDLAELINRTLRYRRELAMKYCEKDIPEKSIDSIMPDDTIEVAQIICRHMMTGKTEGLRDELFQLFNKKILPQYQRREQEDYQNYRQIRREFVSEERRVLSIIQGIIFELDYLTNALKFAIKQRLIEVEQQDGQIFLGLGRAFPSIIQIDPTTLGILMRMGAVAPTLVNQRTYEMFGDPDARAAAGIGSAQSLSGM